MGYVIEFIKYIAKKSQVVGHQLIWNMRTNMYTDEDMQCKDRKYSQNSFSPLAEAYKVIVHVNNLLSLNFKFPFSFSYIIRHSRGNNQQYSGNIVRTSETIL